MPVTWNANGFEVSATYIYLSNIIGLRGYTNYIEVRISVEYVGLATCCAHSFPSYGIFMNSPSLYSPEYYAKQLSTVLFSRASYGQPLKMIG